MLEPKTDDERNKWDESKTAASSKREATASGRLSIKSQIIGWIPQMVPALPRPKQTAAFTDKASA
uniref:Uncharacterized protein n=1 Tax=Moniliophthora roreri TaxID=221103 RepID=A0A0W0F8M6_MONRR